MMKAGGAIRRPLSPGGHPLVSGTELAERALNTHIGKAFTRGSTMKPLHLTVGAAAAVAVLALGAWAPALAQKAKASAKTPSHFSYEIRNGRRVPKASRVQASDGSWKEEVRSGNCSTVRQQGPSGEYREVRKCD